VSHSCWHTGLACLLFAGCQSERQAKENQYREKWANLMEQFQKAVALDDKKAQEYVTANDLASLIKLTRERINSTDATLSEILALYPPPELRTLQGITAYYLVTLIDRLRGQGDLAVAVLSGKTTTDLQQNLNQLVARNSALGSELAVELAKVGMSLKKTPEKPSKAPESAPATTPGG
jgi:hypothetical protein